MQERPSSFGYWLRRRRKALDLTQEALALAASCSRFAIRKIEADERRPSRRLAERLAEKLSIPAAERQAFLDAARAVRPAAALQLDEQPLQPLAGGGAVPFVGRSNEYGLLLGLLARLTTGAGHVALVEGEPGIGKTRLLSELAAYTRAKGMCTLWAQCYEIERAMPYQPVIDLATKAIDSATDAVLRKLAPVSLAEIAALVPAVSERVAVPSLSGDFPEARQARLFRALVQLFEALAAGRQLVVMIDDLQWADDASLQFAHYLARQATSRPLLLACAYRDEDLQPDGGLAVMVASVRRQPHSRHLPLARLALADARALLERMESPALARAGLAERLHGETDGNPFFLTSMLHALSEGNIAGSPAGELPLPDALRASVRARIDHVPAPARAALDVAAVLGRRFDFDALLAVTREPEERLLHSIETLVQRRLLREDPEEGWYDFSHDKVREVAYLEIGAARRISLHRALAEALEARHDGDALERDARLAEHYERGHAWNKAVRYHMLAAERAQKLFAMRDALHWFDRAVALAEAHAEASDGLIALYAQRGYARAQAGQTEGAVADIERVIDDARSRGDRETARDALIQLGMAYRRADDHERAARCLTEALADSRAMGDERRAADTLYHLGTVAWSDCRNREAIGYHAEAVQICERRGLADLVAVQAYHGRGEAHYNNLEPRRAIACFERSIELARGIGDKSYESENLMMIGFASTGLMGLADYGRARASFEAALDIARKADLQWHMGPTLLGLDHVRACTGARDAALEGMQATLRWLESVRHVRYQLIACALIAHVLLDAGRVAEAAARSAEGLELARRSRVNMWRPFIEANLAIARLRLGETGVGADLERAAGYCRENSEGYQLARCLDGLAELALASGDAPGCQRRADELLALVEPAGLPEIAAQARLWRGRALLARQLRPAALEELARAARAAERIGCVRLAGDARKALQELQ